jgi:hypothetical protein
LEKKRGFGKKIAGLFGKLLLAVVVIVMIYAAYLFIIFKKMPSAMAEISGLYGSVIAAQQQEPPPAAQTTVNRAAWTTINNRTTDEQLAALNVGKTELVKLEAYDKVLDSNSLDVINKFMEMVTGNKDAGILSKAQNAEMKRQVEEILAAFKEREEAYKEINR